MLRSLMQENWIHARRSEDRRIAITSVNALSASGVLLALVLGPASYRSLPLAAWLIATSLYGLLACLKLYERAVFHTSRARMLRTRLAELTPHASVAEIHARAESSHSHDHPRLVALRFNDVLIALNLAIGLLGLTYIILIISAVR